MLGDIGDDRGDKADVVDVFAGGPASATTVVDVPGPADTVGIDDELG